MKKFLILIVILFFIFCGFIVYDTYSKEDIPVLMIEDNKIVIDNIYIYNVNV